MNYNELTEKFSTSPARQRKAIFSTLFIAGNRLQTLFDAHIPALSLKQFMLLTLVRQSSEPLTLTRVGELLGCSRQNVKKLADVLEKKGFVTLAPRAGDARAMCIAPTERADAYFAGDFSRYEAELGELFAVYTDEELAALFALLTRLYAGIDRLERHIAEEGQGGECE